MRIILLQHPTKFPKYWGGLKEARKYCHENDCQQMKKGWRMQAEWNHQLGGKWAAIRNHPHHLNFIQYKVPPTSLNPSTTTSQGLSIPSATMSLFKYILLSSDMKHSGIYGLKKPCYESLIAKLRLILLTQGSKQFYHPNMTTIYRVKAVLLTVRVNFVVSIN